LLGAFVNDNAEIFEIMNRRKAAAFLGVCLTTLDRLGIPRTKIRHRTFYKRDVLIKWINEHTEKSGKGVNV